MFKVKSMTKRTFFKRTDIDKLDKRKLSSFIGDSKLTYCKNDKMTAVIVNNDKIGAETRRLFRDSPNEHIACTVLAKRLLRHYLKNSA